MEIHSKPAIEMDTSVISSSNNEMKKQCKTTSYDPITRKIDLRIMPYFVLLEISSYMNRISIRMCILSGIIHY